MSLEKRDIPAGEFKAKCLQIMDEVAQSLVDVVITKRGKPIAKLVPYNEASPAVFGALQGSVTILGDLMEPVDVTWEANLA